VDSFLYYRRTYIELTTDTENLLLTSFNNGVNAAVPNMTSDQVWHQIFVISLEINDK
jgi:hypothetical protein